MNRAALRLILPAISILTLFAALPTHVAAALAIQQDSSAATSASQGFLFSDSFDSTGDLSLWTGDHLLSVTEQAGYEGSYGAYGVSIGRPAFAESRLRDPVPEIYARTRFNIAEQGDNPVVLLRLRSVTGHAILTTFVGTDGLVGYTLDAASRTYTSTQSVTLNTWYEIQVRLRVDGNNSAADVWLNAVPIAELSQRFGLDKKTIGRIEIGDNSAGRTWEARFDDVIASTAHIDSMQETEPVAGTLTVRTTPKLPGLQFVLDGETFLTDADGTVRIKVRKWSADLRQRIQVPKTPLGPDHKGAVATFWAWHGWMSAGDHDVDAFFDLSYPLQLSFVDQNDNPIDISLIDSVVLQSSVGTVYTLTRDQLASPQVLPASRVMPSRKGRVSAPFEYSVLEVNMRGSNVVNRGQQDITNSGSPPAPIKLLLFQATITAQDALFGKRTGESIEVAFPDGGVKQYALDSTHSVVIPLLPRGEYTVSVIGAGYSPPRPMTLSRDQVVELEVVTMLDVAVIGGLIASFALGLLIAGRPIIVTFPFHLYRRYRLSRSLREAQG